MMEFHEDAGGNRLTIKLIVQNLSDEALDELMGICHTEPAEPEICICCAAYIERCNRED